METTITTAPPHSEHSGAGLSAGADDASLPAALVVHLRESRESLCEDWKRRIEEEELFTLENRESILAGTLPALDDYLEALATGRAGALEDYSGVIAERFTASGAESHEVVEMVYLLRTSLVASLFKRFPNAESDDMDHDNARVPKAPGMAIAIL
jgi:hypothetical protein